MSSKRHHVIAGQLRHMHGWHRDAHDPRDRHLTAAVATTLPPTGSVLSIYQPPIRDQGSLGSCTANAGCEAAGFAHHAETNQPDPLFSRLDLYAMERDLEGTPLTEDSGAQVRDVFKAMNKWGVCLEATWPYVIPNFSLTPPRGAAVEGLKYRAITYRRCADLNAIKTSIVQDQHPVIGGFVCFESLESPATAKTGDVPVPAPNEQEIGGHCIYFYGYDDTASDGSGGTGMLLFQNSWGTPWGSGGLGRLPYWYVTKGLASDFWQLKKSATP